MEEIENLSDGELSSKLKGYGLKHGPITKATRRVFEGILRNHLFKEKPTSVSSSFQADENEYNSLAPSYGKVSVPSDSKKENDAENDVYYGVCIGKKENENDRESVFSSLKDACAATKRHKGARLKAFSSKEEAIKFSKTDFPEATISTEILNQEGSRTTFKDPKPQELVLFRKAIEKGDPEKVLTFLENPKYLISSSDFPVVLQEGSRYNAMHVAVKANQLDMVKLIFNKLKDFEFLKLHFPDEKFFEMQSKRMLDYFANSPDKGAGDTPLHIACKFGYVEIVEYLVSLSFVEKYRENKFQETADQVICSRCSTNVSKEKKEISDLLSTKFYVPLLRAQDDAKDPIISAPVSSYSDAAKLHEKTLRSSSPIEPKIEVKAYAGPMSEEQAWMFHKEWKSPRRKNFMNDFQKGKERIGRSLARKHSTHWTEYWSFLGCFADLSTPTGLRKLENYFKNCLQSQKLRHTIPKRYSESKSSLHKQSLLNRSIGGHSDSDFIVRRLLDDFNSEIDSKENSTKNALNIDNEDSNSLDEKEVRTAAFPDNAFADSTPNRPSPNSQLNELRLSMGDLSLKDDTTFTKETGSSKNSNNKHISNHLYSAPSLNEILRTSGEQKFDDPMHGNVIDAISNDCKDVFSPKSTPEIEPFYITGRLPSKFDTDVLQALQGVQYNPTDYPLLHLWMQNVSKFSDDMKMSWPSPCSPRYRSRLASEKLK